ncbi:hypothetical protein H5T56_02880 [Candidatus Bipolaricaulota bacterium]|nr:hypothetical protein [Candidatus Bipolaricaulota bacterium]
MVGTILVALAVLGVIGLASFLRAKRIFARLEKEMAKAWQAVISAMDARILALEELLSALRGAGYAPEGTGKLQEALDILRKSKDDPRALAEADERVEMVLRGIYRALPREREERVRKAQNRLATADEELDIFKNRYNELVLQWYELTRGFSYKLLARGKKKPEPFALPGEEKELARRHLSTL